MVPNFVHAAPLSSDNSKGISMSTFPSASAIFSTTIVTTPSQIESTTAIATSSTSGPSSESLSPNTISKPSTNPEANKKTPAIRAANPNSTNLNSTGEAPTKTDKRYGDTIGPQWFYEEKMRVECPSPGAILNIDMSGIDRSLFPGIDDLNLPLDYSVFPSAEQALAYIESAVRACKDCDCLEDGEMMPNWFAGSDGPCSTNRHVSLCQVVFGCYCSAKLTQPLPTSTAVTADEYQAALDKIPWGVRSDPRNRGYWWKYAPVNAEGKRAWMKAPDGFHPGFTYERGPYRYSAHRQLVPGTKEPYYLEGPDNSFNDVPLGRGEGWIGAGGPFGGSFLVKREDTSPANLGKEVAATKTQLDVKEE
ncbi:hypothetical protein TWF718_003853 [Orbilia javanica]|uniref:Uncharacterized protein n=1 Tax=Orbilia javanica TaxID=47235 RepID=A0AAN8N5F0_9PEZI